MNSNLPKFGRRVHVKLRTSTVRKKRKKKKIHGVPRGLALNIGFIGKSIVTACYQRATRCTGRIKRYLTDKSVRRLPIYLRIRASLFPSNADVTSGNEPPICLRGKLLDSFYDRIDVPNGPFFINKRTNRRCRAGRKFRICMAMQFARSLEAQKLAGAKSDAGKTGTGQKDERTSAAAVEKG